MPEVPVQQSTSPQVITKPMFNWKSVLIAVGIGVVIIGAATAGLRYYLDQNQPSQETGSVTIKSATPSAKTATSSAKPDETANWVVYENTKYKYSIKYPPNYAIRNGDQDTTDIKQANGIGLTDIKYNNDKSTTHFPGLGVWVQNDNGLSLAQWLDKYTSTNEDINKNCWNVKDKTSKVIAGENALEYTCQTGEALMRVIDLIHSGNVFDFSATIQWKNEDLTQDLENIVQTLKFL